ncbi:hypothetical protein ESCCO14588_3548 [Escherichia coli O157:H7 str. TW14588]|uniref:Uncharacterized protein n=1 Tax=Escherichia coli 3.4880 TaxID=1051347 RepID=A0AAV3I762_ECOLX|nr:hypothetical protein ECH7EC4501_4116 [Escherichia coli O157:H7 str. EC4501]EEC26304.1 hypothetical protein ESCCO14588_3548 [Escherichia coli O157:H7 str. TW14588]EIN26488.1 hypothetical protein ECFDA505_2099 [Escherichia coli FDA505]EIN42703.1 hypothetical protein EC93001_2268 [Escherichia coli 93-001]EIN61817.1 hypothetical protein ECPA5_2060 [Escherichia coli PA5]EIN78527.1 hypothetical protein ECPA15_2302 [Escherichia coli PA15]EIO41341.1 hypothetical protein ECPA42_2281 [Escherichia co
MGARLISYRFLLWQKWDKRPQKGQKWGKKSVDYCALL